MSFVEDFASVIQFKFNQRIDEITKEIRAELAEILYVINRHSKQLCYFHPELVQDPMLRSHLEKMVKLNREHVNQLTKDIKINEIEKPLGNVIDLCQRIGLGKCFTKK